MQRTESRVAGSLYVAIHKLVQRVLGCVHRPHQADSRKGADCDTNIDGVKLAMDRELRIYCTELVAPRRGKTNLQP
jgi:hypothetical protein